MKGYLIILNLTVLKRSGCERGRVGVKRIYRPLVIFISSVFAVVEMKNRKCSEGNIVCDRIAANISAWRMNKTLKQRFLYFYRKGSSDYRKYSRTLFSPDARECSRKAGFSFFYDAIK